MAVAAVAAAVVARAVNWLATAAEAERSGVKVRRSKPPAGTERAGRPTTAPSEPTGRCGEKVGTAVPNFRIILDGVLGSRGKKKA